VRLFIESHVAVCLLGYAKRLRTLSLCFNGHFPGEPGSAGVYWSEGWQLDYRSYKSCKAPVRSSPPTSSFLQPGCPSCRPTNSVKALKGKYHIPWTCLPQAHLGVVQLCLWPLIAPGYLGEGCHASHQPSDASTHKKVEDWIILFPFAVQ